MAFETLVLDDRAYNPEMLVRLIETNLVSGAYGAARKFIGILETDMAYRKTAARYRNYLDNDAAAEAACMLSETDSGYWKRVGVCRRLSTATGTSRNAWAPACRWISSAIPSGIIS